MRKSIDFTKRELEKIAKYQKDHELKNFTQAVKSIINDLNDDDMINLIGNAIIEINGKVDQLIMHTAPKSAGEV